MIRRPRFLGLAFVALYLSAMVVDAAPLESAIKDALAKSGDNRAEIKAALDRVPDNQTEGMRFLVAHMPQRDLRSLSAKFLLENVQLAYTAWNESPWKQAVPKEVFFNNVLPYANINERRDDWRKEFYEKFRPLIKDVKSPGKAAAILNQKVFPQLKVRYSTKRRKADQSPQESIESGLASCTGLSVILVDACRSVGVPARFVGTPLWTNKSGNHSWVEVWDDGWHFTGAAEPAGNELDRAWFVGRAASAQRDHPLHAIFAVSYKRTPQTFPFPWDRTIDYVHAVNVTDRYTRRVEKLPEGVGRMMFRVSTSKSSDRVPANLKITDKAGKVVFDGKTKDERFDANDHLTVPLRLGEKYQLEIRHGGHTTTKTIEPRKDDQLFSFQLGVVVAEPSDDKAATSKVIQSLKNYLKQDAKKRPSLDQQKFAGEAITKKDGEIARALLWKDHVAHIRKERAAEMKARTITHEKLVMPFYYKVYGDKPASGRSLFISMHGGGGAPKRVNDQQWENQKRLYQPAEGVYLVPRAATNSWNLWHQNHIDVMFDRLIENLIVFENVDPDRVYLMGYSAGGDGVYQLAPRMADRFAAASMMAGHPNETSPLGLRNLAFSLHVGERDGAYSRNKVAQSWKTQLAKLRKADPGGYEHWAKIYPGKGHWLNREDAAAVPWMAKYRRKLLSERIVWKQDDATHHRFYWLAVDDKNRRARSEMIATRDGQTIDVTAKNVDRVTIRLSDVMLDLDRPITVTSGDKTLFNGSVHRTIRVLAKTLAERGDPKGLFCGEVTVDLPATKKQ
jgi:hypothetical protein